MYLLVNSKIIKDTEPFITYITLEWFIVTMRLSVHSKTATLNNFVLHTSH